MKTIKIFLVFVNIVILCYSTVSQWQQTAVISGGASSFAGYGNYLFASLQQTNFTNGVNLSSDGGANWTYTGHSTSLICSGISSIIATGPSKLKRTTDIGVSWELVGLTNADGWFSLMSSGDNIFASRYSMQRSTDGGATWSILNGVGSSWLECAAAGGDFEFAIAEHSYLYRSTNNGDNWSLTSFPTNLYFKSGAISGNTVYIGTQNHGVYVSVNGGLNWNQSGLSSVNAVSVVVYGNAAFAATTTSGIYLTRNNGANWQQINDGLPSNSAGKLFIHNNYLYVSVSGSGIWKRPLIELVGINQISSSIPNDFSLSRNYPNPFNPVTNIEFSLPKNELVKLVIYDAAGREIETLVNSQLNAGTYKIDWNASGYPSGVYFYSINAGSFSKTNKMMLVK